MYKSPAWYFLLFLNLPAPITWHTVLHVVLLSRYLLIVMIDVPEQDPSKHFIQFN